MLPNRRRGMCGGWKRCEEALSGAGLHRPHRCTSVSPIEPPFGSTNPIDPPFGSVSPIEPIAGLHQPHRITAGLREPRGGIALRRCDLRVSQSFFFSHRPTRRRGKRKRMPGCEVCPHLFNSLFSFFFFGVLGVWGGIELPMCGNRAAAAKCRRETRRSSLSGTYFNPAALCLLTPSPNLSKPSLKHKRKEIKRTQTFL